MKYFIVILLLVGCSKKNYLDFTWFCGRCYVKDSHFEYKVYYKGYLYSEEYWYTLGKCNYERDNDKHCSLDLSVR